jgi:hypothetical protein
MVSTHMASSKHRIRTTGSPRVIGQNGPLIIFQLKQRQSVVNAGLANLVDADTAHVQIRKLGGRDEAALFTTKCLMPVEF